MRKNKLLLTILIITFLFMITACKKNEIEKEAKPQKPIVKKSEMITEYELSSFTTTIIDKSEGRVHNLKLAQQKLDGTIIETGEDFSFNETIGKADEANGYKKAVVIKEEELEMDDGGGICQISSTLYNAAELAGMEIIERHSHTRDVGYIPKGRDAAIAYGKWDLRFKNTQPYPIKIETSITDEQVVITIIGRMG